MPKYEYNCVNCVETFVEIRKIEDRHKETMCPHCATKGKHEMIITSSTPVQFKGKWFSNKGEY